MDIDNKSENITYKNETNKLNKNYKNNFYTSEIVYLFFLTFLCFTPIIFFFINILIEIFYYFYNLIYQLTDNLKKRINRKTIVIEIGNLEHKIIDE